MMNIWSASCGILVQNETNTMTGYHAIPVLADAILKDIPGIDKEKSIQSNAGECVSESKRSASI